MERTYFGVNSGRRYTIEAVGNQYTYNVRVIGREDEGGTILLGQYEGVKACVKRIKEWSYPEDVQREI